jgi:hypothetical protein
LGVAGCGGRAAALLGGGDLFLAQPDVRHQCASVSLGTGMISVISPWLWPRRRSSRRSSARSRGPSSAKCLLAARRSSGISSPSRYDRGADTRI